MNEAVKTEVKEVATLTDPWSASSAGELQRLTDKYARDSSLKLHKAMTLFPTGILIMDSASSIRVQWMEDTKCGLDLVKIQLPPPIQLSQLASELKSLQLPDHKAWKMCRLDLEKVKAKCSERFKEQEAEKLASIAASIEAAGAAMKSAITAGLESEFSRINSAVVSLSEERLETYDHFKAVAEEVEQALPSAKSLMLDVLGPEIAASVDAVMAEKRGHLALVKEASTLLKSQEDFSVHNESAVKLVGLCVNQVPASGLSEEAAKAVQARIAVLLSRALNDTCSTYKELAWRLTKQGSFSAGYGKEAGFY